MRAKRQSPPRGLVESSSYVGITQIRCKGRSCVLPLSLPHKLPCRMKFDTKYTPRAGACQAGTKHGILNLQRKKPNRRGERNVKRHASIWTCGALALCALLACAVSAAGLLYGTRWALLAPGALLGIAPGLAAAASGGRSCLRPAGLALGALLGLGIAVLGGPCARGCGRTPCSARRRRWSGRFPLRRRRTPRHWGADRGKRLSSQRLPTAG